MLKNFLLEKLGIKNSNTIKVQVGKNAILIPQDMAWCFKDGDYYETNFIYWLDKIFEASTNPVFYDIGANYGYYTIKYSSKARQVYAFEPVGNTFQQLHNNVNRNKLKNIALFNSGISDTNSTKKINLYSSSGNNSLFDRDIPNDHPLKKIGEEEIKLVVLDELFSSQKLLPPDIIKLDVEGAELFVLKGCRGIISQVKPIVIFEYSLNTCRDAGYMPSELINEFNTADYSFYGISEEEKDLRLISFDEFENNKISNVIAVPKHKEALFQKWL